MRKLSLFIMTSTAAIAFQSGLYATFSSDLVGVTSDAHQVINYVVDVDPTSGDLIVGGLVQLKSQL